MSRPIAVGDLVQVVRKTCCEGWLGTTYTVKELRTVSGNYACIKCGETGTRETPWIVAYPMGHAIWNLKRIPPLSELEGERTEEKLREPA